MYGGGRAGGGDAGGGMMGGGAADDLNVRKADSNQME